MSERRPDIELSITPPPEALYAQRQRVQDQQRWDALLQAGAAQAETKTPAAEVPEPQSRVDRNVAQIPAVQMAPVDLPPPPEDTPDQVVRIVEATRVAAQSGMDPASLQAILEAAGAGFPATAAGVAGTPAKPPGWLDWLGNVAHLLGQAKATRGGVGEPKVPGARTQTPRESQAARNVAGAAQAGEVEPTAAAAAPRVNLERVGAEGRVRDLITRIDTEMQATGEMGQRTVGTQTHAETIRKSQAPGMSAADLLAIPPEQALNASQQTRLRDLRDRAAVLVDDMARAAQKGDQAAADDLPAAMTLFGDLHARDIAAGETVAQALEARKITSEAARARAVELAALADRYRDAAAADGFDLAARIGTLPNAEARRSFILNTLAAVRRGGQFAQGLFYEYWVNALLSNPVSHARNTLSGALQVLWMPGERFLAAAASTLDKVVFSNPRTVFFSEVAAVYRGMWTGLRRGMELAGKRVRGEAVFGADKAIEMPKAWTSDNFGLPADSLAGSAVDYLGMVLRSPGAAMATEDAFFKGVIFQMELEAQIAREIAKRGLRGEAAVDLANIWRRTPPAEVEMAAQQMSIVKTFNAELGPLGQAFMDFANTAPGARIVFPFIRTPANILKEMSYLTPGLNLLTMAQEILPSNGMLQSKLLNDLAAGGERRAFALAKLAASAVIAAAFVELAGAGVISGPGPKDKNLRRDWQAQGFQPYHIYPDGARPGAEGFSYASGTDPFGTSLGVLATFAEIAGQIPEGDRLALAMAMTLAVSEHMVDKPYLQGMSQLLAAIHAPDKGGRVYIESFTRSLVPGAVRGVARSGIPGLAAGDKMRRDPIALTEMERLLNIVKQSVPGYGDDMPPVLHPITGEPVLFPPGWGPDIVSPIAMSKLKDDPVLKEIVENKVSLPAPGDYIKGSPEPFVGMQEETGRSGVLLSPQEKHDLYVLLTQEVKDGQGRTLHAALTEVVASERYQRDTRGPGGGRELRIKQVYLAFRKNAEAELLRRNDELRNAVEQVTKQRMDLRRPSETPQAPSGPTLPIVPGRVDRPPLRRPSDIRNTLTESLGR